MATLITTTTGVDTMVDIVTITDGILTGTTHIDLTGIIIGVGTTIMTHTGGIITTIRTGDITTTTTLFWRSKWILQQTKYNIQIKLL